MESSITDLKIYGSMVVRNEADRYLQASLHYLTQICDRVVVFDDASTDDSPDIIKSFDNVIYMRRPMAIPTFMNHEGDFRSWAWGTAGDLLNADGHWMFAIDADDLVLGSRTQWENLFAQAVEIGAECVRGMVPEVWSIEPTQVRIDGYWGCNYPTKVARWTSGQKPKALRMGGGSVPMGGKTLTTPDPLFCHFGYALEEDRQEKYNRYTSLGRNSGHNMDHIRSILSRPELAESPGVPEFWRGVK